MTYVVPKRQPRQIDEVVVTGAPRTLESRQIERDLVRETTSFYCSHLCRPSKHCF